MTLYGKFKKLDINFSSLNLESGGGKYFCTPNGARIIGREGVDGIHYCFVKGFGDMVFAVNPSNSDGYVHPLAESFKDFLRLLISCGRTAVLEQALTWNKDEFYEFIKACPLDKGQKALLETIGKSLDLTPMEDPYEYIEALQRSFDCKRLRFSKEYYALVSDSPPSQPEQRVYFSGGFGRHRGRDERL